METILGNAQKGSATQNFSPRISVLVWTWKHAKLKLKKITIYNYNLKQNFNFKLYLYIIVFKYLFSFDKLVYWLRKQKKNLSFFLHNSSWDLRCLWFGLILVLFGAQLWQKTVKVVWLFVTKCSENKQKKVVLLIWVGKWVF